MKSDAFCARSQNGSSSRPSNTTASLPTRRSAVKDRRCALSVEDDGADTACAAECSTHASSKTGARALLRHRIGGIENSVMWRINDNGYQMGRCQKMSQPCSSGLPNTVLSQEKLSVPAPTTAHVATV